MQKEIRQQKNLLRRKDKYGNVWGVKRWPMNDAYCSYLDCSNNAIVEIAFPGEKCKECNRPLSWSGVQKKQVGGKTEYIYPEPRGKWKP